MPPIEPGLRIGSYEIVEQLGQGGMGEVYRARDLNLGREIALKVLRREFARDHERLGRFEREARSASALNHPNLVHIYQIGTDGPHHFIAMELVEGLTLRRVLENDGPLSVKRAVEFTTQVAQGLEKAHAAGIIHRDLKPENIMVSRDGYVKLLDFGLAKLVDSPFDAAADSETETMHRTATRDGMLIGTVEYMSPEQASGKAIDARSDLFSLGIILYEMLTGTLAFHRDSMAQTLAAIIEKAPEPLTKLNPSCPLALEQIVHRLLAKNPKDRPQETTALVEALKTLSSQPPSNLPTPGGTPPPPPIVPTAIQLPNSAVDSVERGIRRPRQALATIYHVKTSGGVKRLSVGRLRRRLRRETYSGLELVRGEGSDLWQPLHETRLFREEVPHRGEPSAWAKRRELGGFISHLASFVGVGAFFFLQNGRVEPWLAFWGIGLFAHGARVLTMGGGSGRALPSDSPEPSTLEQAKRPEPDLTAEILDAAFLAEVKNVREFLSRREDSEGLLSGVDSIVERMRDLATRQKDLAEQTNVEERKRLQASESEIEAKLKVVESAADRRLFGSQLAVVRSRLGAMHKAERVLARLQIRREVAEHQVKNLRLDLARAEAGRAKVPELTSRLEDIRHEVDAREDVDMELGVDGES